MVVTFRVTQNGTSQLGMNSCSVRFSFRELTSCRTYQSWQIVEHQHIQKKSIHPYRKFAHSCNFPCQSEWNLAAWNQPLSCQVFAFTVDVVYSSVPIVADCRTPAHRKKSKPPYRKFAHYHFDGSNLLQNSYFDLLASNPHRFSPRVETEVYPAALDRTTCICGDRNTVALYVEPGTKLYKTRVNSNDAETCCSTSSRFSSPASIF